MRYKKVRVSPSIIIDIITLGSEIHARCVKGLPEGSKFAYAIPDTIYGIWLVVEHESFDLLKNGDLIPEFEVIEMEKVR